MSHGRSGWGRTRCLIDAVIYVQYWQIKKIVGGHRTSCDLNYGGHHNSVWPLHSARITLDGPGVIGAYPPPKFGK